MKLHVVWWRSAGNDHELNLNTWTCMYMCKSRVGLFVYKYHFLIVPSNSEQNRKRNIIHVSTHQNHFPRYSLQKLSYTCTCTHCNEPASYPLPPCPHLHTHTFILKKSTCFHCIDHLLCTPCVIIYFFNPCTRCRKFKLHDILFPFILLMSHKSVLHGFQSWLK